jgi:hypothetical protein
MYKLTQLLILALALFAIGSAGCSALDQAYLQHQNEQLELARAAYLQAAEQAKAAATASGTTDPAELQRVAEEAGTTAVAALLKDRAFGQLLETLKERGPQVASDAVTGNYVGAGAGSLAILMQLVLALWQRGRNQQLAAAIAATMSPQGAAVLTGQPTVAANLPPTVAVAPGPIVVPTPTPPAAPTP